MIIPFRCEQQRFYHLLGNGASALDYFAGLEVLEKGPGNPGQIDAAVFVKAHVFGGEKRLYEVWGKIFRAE